jgi:hypothetical protein
MATTTREDIYIPLAVCWFDSNVLGANRELPATRDHVPNTGVVWVEQINPDVISLATTHLVLGRRPLEFIPLEVRLTRTTHHSCHIHDRHW